MATILYKYQFIQSDQSSLEYLVEIDEKTLNVVQDKEENLPKWTKLSYKKCGHCVLKESEVTHCPVAKNLHKLITRFENTKSIDICEIVIDVPERTYKKRTDIQSGLGSLFGLIMATSSCPSMNFLKPMARFHLPFASMEETIFRSMGSFLIRYYLLGDISKEQVSEDLKKKYMEVNDVNKHLIDRIDHLLKRKNSGDADQNAIVILDTLAVLLTMELSSNISSMQSLFPGEEFPKE